MTGLKFSRIFLLAALFFCIFQGILSKVPKVGWYRVFITDDGRASAPISIDKEATSANTQATPYVAPDHGTIIGTLKGVTAFSGEYMKKLRTGFKAITPFGLYAALGVFKQIATENSASARELGSLVNVKPNIFQGINKYLETLNVNSVNIVYDPPQRTLPLESKASDVFHLAGTSVFHSSEQINAFVDKSTKGLVKKLEVEDPRNLYFFNVLTLKFNWERPFQREQSPKRFMNQNGIRFITVDDLKTKYLQQNEYTAVQLYFGKESINKGEADRVPGVHSYMIQVKNGARLTSDILSRVHTQLLNAEEGSVTFTMPSYKLDEEIKFDKTQFPALLADENKDFSSLGDVKKIKMKQKTTICVDENGASATGITTVETILRSFGLSEEIVFNTAFYHVIVEAESGAPLFIGHVTEANNNKC